MSLTVTLDEVETDFGRIREQADGQAVRVLQDGREVVYLVPPEMFHSMKQGAGQAIFVTELKDEEWHAIAEAQIPEAERYELEDDA